ncbi:MAG: HAMP domain-containing protein, partial [Chloroflexi bacterium]
ALSTRLNQAEAQDLLVDKDFAKFEARASLITNQIERWISEKTRSCAGDRRQAIHAEFAQLQGAVAKLQDAGAEMDAYHLSTDTLETRMVHDLGELRDGLHEYADHVHERLRVFSLALPLLIMSIVMLVAVLLVRSILRPLNQLVEYTQALKRDEYSASVPSGGEDELGVLATALGDMSSHLLNANLQLTEQIQFNQTILLNSPLPIGVYEAGGQCILANEAYANLVGATREELLTQNFNTIAAWQKTGLIDDCRTALKHQIPKYREINTMTSFGKEVWLECRLLPTQLNGHAHLLTQFVDLTERKRLENELRHTIKQQHAREEELRAANQKVEEATRAKSRFLAAAGHDLRQPLAAANLLVGTLKFTKPSANQSEIIENLEGAMSNFDGLLNALLDISKLESGVIEPEYDPVAVADIALWLKQSFAPMAEGRGLAFKLHFPMENLVVFSDIHLLKQVLSNLVFNAIKYTPQGAIMVAARRRGSDVLFQVWDTGIGIEADQFERIFEGFYQINTPQDATAPPVPAAARAERRKQRRSNDSESGLGLGLAIVKRSLALLGVEITCRSQFGRGSVFGFSLPLGDAGQALQPASTP